MHRIQQSILRYALMLLATGLVATTTAIAAEAAASSAATPAPTRATYSDDEVTQAANDFFKNGAQDLGKVLQKVLAGSVIAPVRFGVAWRQGVAVGYMHFSPQKRINPF